MGWVITIAVALLISTGTRAYAVQSYFIPTPSMTPTLMPGDRILVDKLAGTIHRGDIVVFKNPPADRGGPPTLVKRVIGLPGERISSDGATVLINGKPIARALVAQAHRHLRRSQRAHHPHHHPGRPLLHDGRLPG